MSMSIEVSSEKARCYKCGADYSRRKGYFPVSYALQHKGVGHIPVCKECIDNMYNTYLAQCNDAKSAVRQMCRKLDLYWSESVYEIVSRKSTTRTMMTQYIAKINSVSFAGKSYDDTLSEEGTLWSFTDNNIVEDVEPVEEEPQSEQYDTSDISEEDLAFWGAGYSPSMYDILSKKFEYYKSRFYNGAEVDLGTERLLRQACILEATIDRDSAAGRSVEKSVNTLNTIFGSLNLKPTQKKDDGDASIDNTPFGVWIRRWENQRPIPEPDPELQDVDGIVRYISIWYLGHLCKMLGIKNTYCKLYEEELTKMRIERPEYEDEDDETIFNDIFGSDDSGEESDSGGNDEP